MSEEAEDSISVRRKKRYNHIPISLRINIGDEWKWIKALDWNESGFNFHLDHEMADSTVNFKKSITPFRGDIVWDHMNGDDNSIMEMIVNTLLFKQMKKQGHVVRDSARRIINLIRTQGLIDEKIKMLAVLGMNNFSYRDVETLIASHKKSFPMYRYGIRFDSAEWSSIVKYALDISSAALVMDTIGEGFSGVALPMTERYL